MKAAAMALWLVILVLPTCAQSPANVCALPKSLQDIVAVKYPGAKVITLSDLNEDDQQFFQKDHHGACPGLVKVDFYGDDKPTFALSLATPAQTGFNTQLVVAHLLGANWKTTVLGETGGPAPAIWSEKPGAYEGVYGAKMRSTRSVILFVGYESWAVTYAWDGRKVKHIQIND
jgi:hypothetical protein